MNLEHAGFDQLGREVYLCFAPDLVDLKTITFPTSPFVLFLGVDATGLIPEPLSTVADAVLDAGAVYVLCWGPDCGRAEDLVDEAAVGARGGAPFGQIMTTSHAEDSIHEALDFATSVAVPDDMFVEACTTVVVAFIGNVDWYNEGQNCLEDLLS